MPTWQQEQNMSHLKTTTLIKDILIVGGQTQTLII